MIPNITSLTTYKDPAEFDKWFDSFNGAKVFSSGDRELAKVSWNQALLVAQRQILNSSAPDFTKSSNLPRSFLNEYVLNEDGERVYLTENQSKK